MSHTNWVYTLIRAIHELGGEARVSEIEQSKFIREEQSRQSDLAATIRGSVHDYCSDHSSGRDKGAHNGNARDVFKKIGPARWQIRDYTNPFVKIALRKVNNIEEMKKELLDRDDITSVGALIRDIDIEKTVHVDEHWRSPPNRSPYCAGISIHYLDRGPHLITPSSHAVEFDGWLFLAGQLPTEPSDPSAPLPEGIHAQASRVMENIGMALAGLDLKKESVVITRCYLTELRANYPIFVSVYRSFFQSRSLPVTTIIGVDSLPCSALVQIDVVARRASS